MRRAQTVDHRREESYRPSGEVLSGFYWEELLEQLERSPTDLKIRVVDFDDLESSVELRGVFLDDGQPGEGF